MTLTEPLSRLFQTESLDVHSAAETVKSTVNVFQEKRSNVEEEFSKIFKEACQIAQDLNVEISLPRIVQKQRNRPNAPSGSAEEHYRRNIFIPVLDWILEDIASRFSEERLALYSLNVLLLRISSSLRPGSNNAALLKCAEKEDIDVLSRRYASLLGTSAETLKAKLEAEISLWSAFWRRQAENDRPIPSKALDVYDACNPQISRAIKSLLQILITLIPSIATAERSYSTLRAQKTHLRSNCGEARLNGLALMSIGKCL